MSYRMVLAMLVVFAAGCTTGDKGDLATPDKGSDAATPENTTPSASSSLGNAFSYTELPEGKHAKSMDCRGHLAAVDYKSKLIIKPDTDRVKELANTKEDVLPPLSPEVQARLQNLPELIKEAEKYVDDATRVLRAVEAAKASGRELSPNEIRQLQQEIVAQGVQGGKLMDLVVEVAEARARAQYRDDEDAVVAEVSRLTDPLVKDARGNDVILNVEAFGAFLGEEIDSATAEARRDAELAEREGAVLFRMWAWLDSQSDWVSIENYFDAGGFEGPKRPRVTFRMSDADQERLKQGYQLADESARFVRDMRNKESSLRVRLASLWKTSSLELKDLAELPADVIAKDAKDVLMTTIDKASGSSEATDEEKEELAELKTFLDKELNDDLTRTRTVFQKLEAIPSSAEFINRYIAFTTDVNAALDVVIRLPEKIRTNIGRLDVLADVLKKMNTEERKELLASVEEQVLPNTKGQLDALVDKELVQYATLAAKVQGLLSAGQPLNLAKGLETTRERPPVRAVRLDEITDGAIYLNKTRADRGSELTIRTELFTTDEKGKETVQQWSEQSFQVDRYGLTSDFSANVLFVNRFGGGEPGDPDTDFDPAPSASWNLHYRLRPDADDDWLKKLYCFFDPGFGINTAVLDFEDENVQIGAGVHLTLFEDLLIFGYGYNLQAETDNDYFYFGIGVLEALDTIGSLFGAASGTLNRGAN